MVAIVTQAPIKGLNPRTARDAQRCPEPGHVSQVETRDWVYNVRGKEASKQFKELLVPKTRKRAHHSLAWRRPWGQVWSLESVEFCLYLGTAWPSST